MPDLKDHIMVLTDVAAIVDLKVVIEMEILLAEETSDQIEDLIQKATLKGLIVTNKNER